jgi:hypothetical protein
MSGKWVTQQHPGAAGVVVDQHGVDEALHDLDTPSATGCARAGVSPLPVIDHFQLKGSRLGPEDHLDDGASGRRGR